MREPRSRSARPAFVILGAAALFAAPFGAAAQQGSPTTEAVGEAAAPRYTPPLRGAPKGRIGSGTRGSRVAEARFDVVAPDHVGLTLQEQPTLYFHASRPVAAPVLLTIVAPDRQQPLVETMLPGPVWAGVNAVPLAQTAVRLQPGKEYEWSVSVVLDAAERSRDIMAAGLIERVTSTAEGRALAALPAREAARRYAAAGLWYDAVDVLSRALAQTPTDATLRRDRAALLEQVGLREAIEVERRALISGR